jgi:pyruvate dehydrogenase E2 component (dihydrolipoamide acetyltransferase)
MATILRMPAVLANATEAVLASWVVAEGDAFSVGDPLAELETEKALVDLPAEQDGVLGRVLVRPGESIQVGAPIAVLVSAGEGPAEIEAALGADAVGGANADEAHASPAVAADLTRPADRTPPPAITPDAPAQRQFASPIALRLAKENDVAIAGIAGSGPGGRVVRRDVEAAVNRKPHSRSAPGASGNNTFTEIPHTPMRRAIARRLTESKSTVPHFYLTADCVVDELLELRRQINAQTSARVSVNDLVVKAVAAAFADVPEANVTWSDESLRRWDRVDVGIAVATDVGLLTPVLRAVDGLGVRELSERIRELVDQARHGRLRQDELEGGSITVTNLGMYGTTEFSAIINPPQAAILAVGAATPQAVVVDGEVRAATVMTCTLSVDHRAIDGALAARWLAAFESKLAHPISILV